MHTKFGAKVDHCREVMHVQPVHSEAYVHRHSLGFRKLDRANSSFEKANPAACEIVSRLQAIDTDLDPRYFRVAKAAHSFGRNWRAVRADAATNPPVACVFQQMEDV